jgi:hypothetical protein
MKCTDVRRKKVEKIAGGFGKRFPRFKKGDLYAEFFELLLRA